MFGLFNWIANSRMAQAMLGALGVLIGLKVWGESRERDGRIQERAKAREKAVQKIRKMEKEADDTLTEVEAVRERSGHYPTADSVPDHIAKHAFRD